jgi:hypothetical protein
MKHKNNDLMNILKVQYNKHSFEDIMREFMPYLFDVNEIENKDYC